MFRICFDPDREVGTQATMAGVLHRVIDQKISVHDEVWALISILDEANSSLSRAV
jgi:hypothetical protein